MAATTSVYVPDALDTLRDSFALHLAATRSQSTIRIYLAALDGLRRYLTANGMPTTARAVRREHIEAYIASRREVICIIRFIPCSESGMELIKLQDISKERGRGAGEVHSPWGR